ncbi:PorP/SprF family type IX secretion system membrane protein [Myroides sp. LJL116]
MNFTRLIKNMAICLFAISGSNALAQQDPQYTQYMYNPTSINPAYAGTRQSLSFFGHYRTQWVGLDGAPKTASVAMNTPIGRSGLGLGASFRNEKIGVMSDNTFAVDLSYAIDISYRYKLSFGIKASGNLLDVKYSDLYIYNQPSLYPDIKSKFTPNIGAGLYLYDDKSYLGLSVPHILSTDRYDDNDYLTVEQKAHFYLMGGYVFEINDQFKLKPAFLAKAVQGAPVQLDLTANALFMDKFTLGAAYRVSGSVSGLAGFQINESLFIGYSYDAETTKLKHYNSGSHEFLLRFELFNHQKRTNTPRFF